MFPFQPLDLSKLSYAAVLDILAPILPGGTIALGWLYSHPAVWVNLHDERSLKIIIAGFAIYSVGFVALYLSTSELAMIALAVLIRKTEIHEPWKNTEWRRLASKFLGAEISPPVEEPPAEPPEQPLSFTNAENLSKAIDENWAKRMAPHNFRLRWDKWYQILKARFPIPPNAQLAFANFYFSTLNSIGWAGLISAYISSRHVGWLVWFACVLTIIVSHVSYILNFSQQQYPDPSGDQLAAEILKSIEARGFDTGSDNSRDDFPGRLP